MSISYTRQQRAAIALAWSHLDSFAMPSGVRARLNDAVSIERKGGFSDRIGSTQARAMVINWFHDGYQTPTLAASMLAGVRISCAVATLAGIEVRCDGRPLLSADGVAAIAEACRAHQSALDRSRG